MVSPPCALQVICSARGRGLQLNAGWRACRPDSRWVLFCHADSSLPPGYEQLIQTALFDSRRQRWAWREQQGSQAQGDGSAAAGGKAAGAPCAAARTVAALSSSEPVWGGFSSIRTDIHNPFWRSVLTCGEAAFRLFPTCTEPSFVRPRTPFGHDARAAEQAWSCAHASSAGHTATRRSLFEETSWRCVAEPSHSLLARRHGHQSCS
jgi:hypothetical protein